MRHSPSLPPLQRSLTSDIWYNKWAGGDKEDALAKYVAHYLQLL